jgi:predicted dehydrogenase
MEPLRVGLVGLNFGKKVVTGGIKNGSIELVACYSRTPSSRKAFAGEFGCLACETYREMLEIEDLEAAIVISPNHDHLEHVYEAAARGKHVFVDKPIANSITEAKEIISLCEGAGVKLAVGHSTRFYGSYTKIRELIKEGRIGQPLAVECHFGASNAFSLRPGDWRWNELTCPGLALIQMGIHPIDVMRTILGDVVSVSAHFENVMVHMGNPDLNALIMEFESGATGVMICSYIHNDYYTVWHGSEGVLRYMYWPDDGRIERLDKLGHVDESDHWIEFEKVDPLAVEMKDFQRAVRENSAPIVTGEEGLKSLLPVIAAVESARTGRRVFVDELI